MTTETTTTLTLTLNGKNYTVATVEDAARIVNSAWGAMGAPQWYKRNPGGAPVRRGDVVVASVSYNGRLWNPCAPGETATPYAAGAR